MDLRMGPIGSDRRTESARPVRAFQIGREVKIARMAHVDEVANLTVWLASDQASYCTGGDYAADGGVTAGKPPARPAS